MIFQKEPADFSPRFTFTGCYVECNGRIVLLHRHADKSEGNKWGIPGGKVEPGETLPEATVRELTEETGLVISPEQLTDLGVLYVRHTEYDLNYARFRLQVSSLPAIKINDYEHSQFMWAAPKEALQMDLVHDLAECLTLVYPEKVNARA